MPYVAHKIELDPTVKQKAYFNKAVGAARFAYNWGLAEWEKQYAEGKKPTGWGLSVQFNKIKHTEFPWTSEISATAMKTAFEHLDTAFKRYFRKTSKRPTFKKKYVHDSYRVDNSKDVRVEEHWIKVPRLGYVKMKENLRFNGDIVSVVISREGRKWFVSLNVNTGVGQMEVPSLRVIGVDLGIKEMATCSDGTVYAAPRPMRRFEKKLKRLQRAVSRKVKGSANRRKTVVKLGALRRRARNIRLDAIHKMTTEIVTKSAEVVIEDLDVIGMRKNKVVAKALNDVGLFEMRRQLQYKCNLYGRALTVVDRYYPSSKTCHRCGMIKDVLTLADRVFKCDKCGLEIDRDLNAAINLSTVGPRPELTPVESGGSLET